jgi:hypothetical protein
MEEISKPINRESVHESSRLVIWMNVIEHLHNDTYTWKGKKIILQFISFDPLYPIT